MLNSEKRAIHEAFIESASDRTIFDKKTAEPPPDRKHTLQPGIRIELLDSELWFECYKRKSSPGSVPALFACRYTTYDYVAETYVASDWLTFSGEHSFKNDKGTQNYYGTLSDATAELAKWLREVVPPFHVEMTTLDPWTSTTVMAPVGEINLSEDDRPLVLEEQLRLQQAVNEIRELIIGAHDLSDHQRQLIESHLSRLSAAVSLMGRTAWFTFAIGTVATIGSTLFLNNAQGRQLWEATRDILNRALLSLT